MPAISRPLLIALIGAVLALVAFYAMQGARGASESNEDAAIEAPVKPAEPSRDAAPPEPRQKVDKAEPRQKADKAEPRVKADKTKKAESRKVAPAPKAPKRVRRTPGVPLAVERALNRGQTVVLFFSAPAADDRATARAVDSLRAKPGVRVFSDPIRRLARYRGLIGALGISQAPAVVIVGKDREARVVEGFVDPATLAQDVADSR
jgi:outer membrane biosynthesis protein TonB